MSNRKTIMRWNTASKALMTATLCILCVAFVAAQPDVDNAPKSVNPPNTAPPAPRVPRNEKQTLLETAVRESIRIRDMTPAAREQYAQQMQEKSVRSTLNAGGFNDLELQDLVVKFLQQQHAARKPLRVMATLIALGTTMPSPRKLSDTEFDLVFKAYLDAIEKERTRRKSVEAELDTKIGWSHKPKLHAILLTNGYIGDAAYYAGNTMGHGVSDVETVRNWNAGQDVLAALKLEPAKAPE